MRNVKVYTRVHKSAMSVTECGKGADARSDNKLTVPTS